MASDQEGRLCGKAVQEFGKNWRYLVIIIVPVVFCPIAVIYNNSVSL